MQLSEAFEACFQQAIILFVLGRTVEARCRVNQYCTIQGATRKQIACDSLKLHKGCFPVIRYTYVHARKSLNSSKQFVFKK